MNNSAVLALCGRTLTIVAGVVFVISLSFPVVAGLSKDPGWFPKLWRVLDIAIALVLVILAFPIITLAAATWISKRRTRATARIESLRMGYWRCLSCSLSLGIASFGSIV
jgi:hypothetical protein